MKHRSIGGPLLFLALIVATLVSLLAPRAVMASLAVILAPEAGPPGTEVSGRTGGQGAFSSQVEPLRAYLVAATAAADVTTPGDPGLVEIGELVVDAAGDGRIWFRVPRLEPGAYVLTVFCPSCAPTSAGRTMLGVATFVVTPPPPSTDSLPGASTPPGLIAAALLVVTVLGLVVLRRRQAR